MRLIIGLGFVEKTLMGIRGLYTYLKHYKSSFDLRAQKESNTSLRIGIDAMSFLYRYKEQTEDIQSVLRILKGLKYKLLFVFDGKPPIEKEAEIVARKDARQTAATKVLTIETFLQSDSAKQINNLALQLLEDSLKRCQTKSWCASRAIRRAFQDLLWDEGIPYVKSISEADDVLIDLFNGGKLDVIMSSDMDYLAAGIKCIWIPSQKGIYWFEEIQLDEVLKGEDITTEQFTEIGFLSTDYKVQCDIAFTWLRHYGSIEAVLQSTIKRPPFTLIDIQNGVKRFKAQPIYSRIRPDHFERVTEFLEAL